MPFPTLSYPWLWAPSLVPDIWDRDCIQHKGKIRRQLGQVERWVVLSHERRKGYHACEWPQRIGRVASTRVLVPLYRSCSSGDVRYTLWLDIQRVRIWGSWDMRIVCLTFGWFLGGIAWGFMLSLALFHRRLVIWCCEVKWKNNKSSYKMLRWCDDILR